MMLTIAKNFLGLHIADVFSKRKYSMRCIASNILWNQFLLFLQNMSGVVSLFMQTMSEFIWLEVSNIIWFKFSQNCFTSSLLSAFGTIILLSIQISEALSEGKFLSFERYTSSRNSRNVDGYLTDHFVENVQEMDWWMDGWIDRLIWIATYEGQCYLQSKFCFNYFC
jgi:hypothetical protein